MKCSKHPDKDAAAICESCNLLYCGSCALSSNGKCPKCGNPLHSPKSVLPYEISQNELYKGKGQPRFLEALNSLYVEPERAIRRLKEYPSLFTGVINITVIYLIITVLRLLISAIIVLGFIQMPGSNANLFGAQTIFAFIILAIFYFGVFILAWLFMSLIYFLPAKLLGGKGTYVQQACLLSYIMLATLPLEVLVILLAALPILGPLIAVLANLAVSLYMLFITFLSIREANEFSNIRAAISFVISLAVFAFLAFLLTALLVLIFAMPFIGNLPYPSF
jgi:hypothetical protein